MRFFVWVDFQYYMIALFLGAISLIMVYLAWAAYPGRPVAGTEQDLEQKNGGGQGPEKTPVVPFLICTYLLIAAWAFSYLIFVWARGSRF